MKKLVLLTILALLPVVAGAQKPREVRKANYEQAERFSQKKLGQMVYSTRIRPNWFARQRQILVQLENLGRHPLLHGGCRHRHQDGAL